MTEQVQTLPEALIEGVTFTPEQIAEMDAIPSREILSDEKTKNPHYNPRMDPGSERWDAYGYFSQQEQKEVYVHIDPESPELEVFEMSINGFSLPCYPGKRQKMPSDFVELLRGRNQRLDVHERGLVSRDENQEGSLTLAVGGARAKPFIHRVAD